MSNPICLVVFLIFGHVRATHRSLDPNLTSVGIKSAEALQQNTLLEKASRDTVGICAIADREDKYIVEWIDYHLGIGVDMIYLLDNSEKNTLKPLNKSEKVTVIPFPGRYIQVPAYKYCQRNLSMNHKWMGHIDPDEFLMLYRHKTIQSFLKEYLTNGSLSLNWIVFGTSNQTEYQPKPVTLRFQRRFPWDDTRVKNFYVSHDVFEYAHPHHPTKFRKGTDQHDTKGYPCPHGWGSNVDCDGNSLGLITLEMRKNVFDEPVCHNNTDVAALYHYRYKSVSELRDRKCNTFQGKHETPFADKFCKQIDPLFESPAQMAGVWFNNLAWEKLKEVAPKYQICESQDSRSQKMCAKLAKF